MWFNRKNDNLEYTVTKEKITAFLTAVDDDAFVISDIAAQMGITDDEALAILRYLMENNILKVKCIWVPEKKVGTGLESSKFRV